MCSPAAAVAGGTLGLKTVGNYMSQSSMSDYYQDLMNAQAKAAITSMNYNIQNLEQQRTDAFDKAVQEISNTRLNSLQINSGVKAAINETMSGRTGNLLVRSAEGDTARAVSSVQENYERKSNEIDLNRERQVLSTHDYLEGLNASAPQMPSRFTNFMTFAGDALGSYAMYKGLDTKSASGTSGATATATKSAGTVNTPTYQAPQFVSTAQSSFIKNYGSTWNGYDLEKRIAGYQKYSYGGIGGIRWNG